MPWVKLDDQFTEHPKVVQAGPTAAWLYVCGLTYCARQLTDGFIPAAQLRRLVAGAPVVRLAQRLVAVGLWEPADGGFRVHDYLEYNPTRAQTLALRKQRASAGSRGGKQKASNLLATSQAPASDMLVANPYPVPHPRPHEAEATETATPTHGDSGDRGVSGAGAPVLVLAPAQMPSGPKARQRNEYPADFEAWWSVYPNKEAKYKALESWRQRRKAGRSVEALQAAVGHLAEYVKARGTPVDKIPHATTFLNQRRDENWEHGPPNGPAQPVANGYASRPQRESPMEQARRRILAGPQREAS